MSEHALALLLVFAGPLFGFAFGRLSRPRPRRRFRPPTLDRQTITPAEAHALDVECCERARRAGYQPARRIISGGYQPEAGPKPKPPRGRSGVRGAWSPVGEEPPVLGPIFVGKSAAIPPPPLRVEVTLLRKPPPSRDD